MASPWDDLHLHPGDRPNSYLGSIDPDWVVRTLPIGGFLVGLAAEAMARTLNNETQLLRTITAMFAGPVRNGHVEIDVSVLRQGRSVSQLTATLRNVGAEAGVTVVAAFGASRRGFTFTDLEMPTVPAPENCKTWVEAKPADVVFDYPPSPYWTKVVESRLASGRWDWEPCPGGRAEDASWFRFFDAPTTGEGLLHRAALAVLADSMPGALNSKVDELNWFAPSIDLTIHMLGDVTPGWILAHSRASWAGSGYASASVDLWDPRTGVLAAHATQMMVFAFSE